MRILTEDALLVCPHQVGKVRIRATQSLVRVGGRRVLVERDPEGRSISGCPIAGPGFKPCTSTLPVQRGYSDLVRVEGRRVCLDTVTGLTDGTPPGSYWYLVRQPGQALVSEAG